MTWFKKGLRLIFHVPTACLSARHPRKWPDLRRDCDLSANNTYTLLHSSSRKWPDLRRDCDGAIADYNMNWDVVSSKMTWFKKGLRLGITVSKIRTNTLVTRKWPDLRRDCDTIKDGQLILKYQTRKWPDLRRDCDPRDSLPVESPRRCLHLENDLI